MERTHLSIILERIASGTSSPSDIEELAHACRAGLISVATGEQAVALGRDANDAVIVTGDHNVIRECILIGVNGVPQAYGILAASAS